ncbi:MAG: hypothetical protein LBD74_07720, partial [Spirochaetaceae bacterium]|nr:hypothetical protein [Spirochaetaceae bacterium]
MKKHTKWAVASVCALLFFGGCENITEEYYTVSEDLAVSLVGAYGVTHPNDITKGTNYILLAVDTGDYTKGTYTLADAEAKATPVLADGGRTTLVKIPVGGGG